MKESEGEWWRVRERERGGKRESDTTSGKRPTVAKDGLRLEGYREINHPKHVCPIRAGLEHAGLAAMARYLQGYVGRLVLTLCGWGVGGDVCDKPMTGPRVCGQRDNLGQRRLEVEHDVYDGVWVCFALLTGQNGP